MPLKNPLIRVFSGLTFYLMLPIAMVLFARKAAVFPAWGWLLFTVAAAVIVSHVMLSGYSWRSKVLLSVIAATIAWAVIFGWRRFELGRANLSNQWIVDTNLSHA